MHFRGLLGAAILGLVMTACGADSEGEAQSSEESVPSASAPQTPEAETSATTEPTPDRDALRHSVEVLAATRVAGDIDQVKALLSDFCQHRLTLEYSLELIAVRELGYPTLPELDRFSAKIDDKTAHVTYTFVDAPKLGVRDETWYLQDGEWRQDECSD